MGYVMTKKGVITNNFIEFNHLNEVTIDNMLTKMMYELINKPYKEMKYLAQKFVMLPIAINALHMYAYMNQVDSFEKAVEDGMYYLKSQEGTPLKIAM